MAEGEFARFNTTIIKGIKLERSQYYQQDPSPIHDWGTEIQSHIYIDFHNKTLSMEELGSEVETSKIVTRDEVWIWPWQRFRNFIMNLLHSI